MILKFWLNIMIKNLIKVINCPICKSERSLLKGKISSKIKQIDKYFSLKLCIIEIIDTYRSFLKQNI